MRRLFPFAFDQSIPGLAEEAFAAAARLASYSYGYSSWNRRAIEAVLQDLLLIFREDEAFLTSVRFVTREAGVSRLRLFALHSRFSNQLPDEKEYEAIPEELGGIGWQAVKLGKAITFVRQKCSVFRPIHRDSEKVKAGICMPVKFFARGHCCNGVLSLDFGSEVKWTTEKLCAVLQAVRRLSWMATDNCNGIRKIIHVGRGKSSWADFWSLVSSGFKAGIGSMLNGESEETLSTMGDAEDAKELQRVFATTAGKSTELSKELVRFGVRGSVSHGMFSTPLHCGAFIVGHLRALMKDASRTGAKIEEILEEWDQFIGATLSLGRFLEIGFVCRDEDDGLSMWDEVIKGRVGLWEAGSRTERGITGEPQEQEA